MTHGWTDLTFVWEKTRWCGNSCFLPSSPPLLLFFHPPSKSSTLPLSPPPGRTGFQPATLDFTHTLTHVNDSCKSGCNQTGSGHHLSLPQRKRMLCLCAYVCTTKCSGKKNNHNISRWKDLAKMFIVGKVLVHWTLFNNLLKTYLWKYIRTMLEEGPGVNTAGRTGAGMCIKATLSLNLNCPHSKHNTQDFWISEVMSVDIFGWYFILLF